MNKHLTTGLWIFSGAMIAVSVYRHNLGHTLTNVAWMLVGMGLVHAVFCGLALFSKHSEAKEQAALPTTEELRASAMRYLGHPEA
jgi:uncharacterized membrane protein YbhN (UPF0104 family)